jgi:hypothetical protein
MVLLVRSLQTLSPKALNTIEAKRGHPDCQGIFRLMLQFYLSDITATGDGGKEFGKFG